MSKELLIVISHSPFGHHAGREALETVMAAAVFEQPLSLLFIGEGVWQLIGPQDGEPLGTKAPGKWLSALPLYGVENLYACAHSLAERGLNDAALALPVQTLATQELPPLFRRANHCLSF